MDAADFKGLVSDQWHVGVVGTNDLAKKIIYTVVYSCNARITACQSDTLQCCRGLVQVVLPSRYWC